MIENAIVPQAGDKNFGDNFMCVYLGKKWVKNGTILLLWIIKKVK